MVIEKIGVSFPPGPGARSPAHLYIKRMKPNQVAIAPKPKLVQNLFYPWESITLNMTPAAAEKAIQDAGLHGGCHSAVNSRGIRDCKFKGNWKGQWRTGIRPMKVSATEINRMVISINYPSSARKQIEERLLRIVPSEKRYLNCDNRDPNAPNLILSCSNIKDAATSALIKFTINQSGEGQPILVMYDIRR